MMFSQNIKTCFSPREVASARVVAHLAALLRLSVILGNVVAHVPRGCPSKEGVMLRYQDRFLVAQSLVSWRHPQPMRALPQHAQLPDRVFQAQALLA